MMQGRRHCRPLHGKARAMACGGNPRALPDLMAAASAADPRNAAPACIASTVRCVRIISVHMSHSLN